MGEHEVMREAIGAADELDNGAMTEDGLIQTNLRVVKVIPVLYEVQLPFTERRSREGLAKRPGDEVTYQTGEVRNGHGRCSGAVVTVQIGTSADIDIDFRDGFKTGLAGLSGGR
jgi:hypothetical protein